MVSPLDSGARVDGAAVRGKHVLPSPVASGVRVLAFERLRKPHGAEPCAKIASVYLSGSAQLGAKRLDEAIRTYRNPVFPALAIANQDCATREIDVLTLRRHASMTRNPVP
jgi:hypothetical protein